MKQKGEPFPRLEARVIDSILRTVIIARVRHRGENTHLQNFVLSKNNYVEIRNSCLLLVEKWNGSRHLVF
jgi:hypothetical protein